MTPRTEDVAVPEQGEWRTTAVPDWLIFSGIEPSVGWFYVMLRSIRAGGTATVQRHTTWELCQLYPSSKGQPSSPSRIRDLFRKLGECGMATDPYGSPVIAPTRNGGQHRELSYLLYDFPAEGADYPGTRSGEDSLAAVRTRSNALRPRRERPAYTCTEEHISVSVRQSDERNSRGAA